MFNSAEIDILLEHLRQKLQEVETEILTLEDPAYVRCEAVARETPLPAIQKRSNHRRRSSAYGRSSRLRR